MSARRCESCAKYIRQSGICLVCGFDNNDPSTSADSCSPMDPDEISETRPSPVARCANSVRILSANLHAMSAEQRETKNRCKVLEERFDQNDKDYEAIKKRVSALEEAIKKCLGDLEESMRQMSLSAKESQTPVDPESSTSESEIAVEVKTPERG